MLQRRVMNKEGHLKKTGNKVGEWGGGNLIAFLSVFEKVRIDFGPVQIQRTRPPGNYREKETFLFPCISSLFEELYERALFNVQ